MGKKRTSNWTRRQFLAAAAAGTAGAGYGLGLMAPRGLAADNGLPEWTNAIRSDHPRLFINADTLPRIRERALGAEQGWFDDIRQRIDQLANQRDNGDPRDLGSQAAQAAFIFLVTEDSEYRDLGQRWLETSLDYYHLCYEERRAVDWYSTSRVHATLAWDWLYNHMEEEDRTRLLESLIAAIHNVLTADPPIYREHPSGYDRGFYGVRNCQWFIGCTGFGTGIEPERVEEWLTWGREENLRLLEYRQRASSDNGGSASATITYAFGAYPWAEQNFLYTWLSATDEDISGDWPHSALLSNYILWNWIEGEDRPLEFGYGDTPHRNNHLPINHLYTHLANIRQLHADAKPEAAALARYIQDRLPSNYQRYTRTWFIYPFLFHDLDQTPDPIEPEGLPLARHFDEMGQIFMRSGDGKDDTYCLFSCGGILRQHRHYDALNFVIYHKGFLALDSGTRHRQFDNGQHLANYYAQTVAHNCVLIHQPGEPPANYWGGSVEANHGGQHNQLGSEVTAFETNDDFVYTAGDGTETYLHGRSGLPEKAEEVTRQIVFLPSSHFVIFDRVTVTDPEYGKEWLLHTAHEPDIDGRVFRADHWDGRLLCQCVLPEDASIEAIGGPGKEFWAAGQNWDIVADDLSEDELAMMGQWRVEVSPGEARESDVFLHVVQVGDQDVDEMVPTERITEENREGVRLTLGDETWEITFRTTGALGGHIRREGGDRPPLDQALTGSVQPQSGIWAD